MGESIVVGKEYALTSIALLRDVMGHQGMYGK